jgi:ATP-dependent RNA helicase DDX54/DBP10
MDLIPDDDAVKNMKGKTAMKWDAKKKRYMLKKIDRDGKVIAEKRNESGAKITKKMKEKEKVSIYKKWQQKTHLSLQKTGEMEDSRVHD